MLIIVSLFLAILYGGGIILLSSALRKRQSVSGRGFRPSVSVIVAARNEEEDIEACLSSLARLSYPRERLEIIIVDDHSTDGTSEIVSKYVDAHPGFRLIRAAEPAGNLRGKVNALVTGIEATRGDILMFTDADCRVPPGWVEKTVEVYADSSVAMVGGFIAIEGRSWFDAIQTLDWLLLVSAASATAALKFPVTAVGNNLSVRRTAYDRAGGYRSIPFSITEDLALVKAVTGSGAGDLAIPLGADTAVRTNPCRSISDLIAQRRRWFVGGQGMRPTRALAFLGIFAFHLVLVAGFWFLNPLVWAGMVVMKLIADFLLILPSKNRLNMHGLMRYWIPFQVYLALYILVLPIVAFLSGSVRWKGRIYRGRSQHI